MKDFFQNLINVFKDRTDNPWTDNDGKGSPFGGTFIFIWFVYNWRLIFSVFNFDKGFTLFYKLCYIESYIKLHGYWIFGAPLLLTFGSLLLFYLASSGALVISKTYHAILTPVITKKIAGNSSVRTKEEFEGMKTAYLAEMGYKEEAYKQLSQKEIEVSKRIEGINQGYEAEIGVLRSLKDQYEASNHEFIRIQPYIVLASSSGNTDFVNSPDHPLRVKMGAKAVNMYLVDKPAPWKIHGSWMESHRAYIDKLPKAFWIADRDSVTDEESASGGTYIFRTEFSLDFDPSYIESIIFYGIVDDYLTLKLNDTPVRNSEGNLESVGFSLHEYNLTEHCRPGTNVLTITVRNSSGGTTGLNNPYGVIFSVLLSLKNPYINK